MCPLANVVSYGVADCRSPGRGRAAGRLASWFEVDRSDPR